MDIFATYLIYTHAILGCIALIAGFIAIITKKGKNAHKKSGSIFYYSMLSCALSALIIAVLPNHENPFLFTIGVFSSYFIVTGYRALRFKKRNPNLSMDKLIAIGMLITGILMILYPILLHKRLNPILSIFGTVGIIVAARDLYLFKKPKQLQKNWLKNHIGKMLGGYIAAVTAFIVVNQFIPGIAGWLLPSVFGSMYMNYWFWKLRKKASSTY